jgi:hypothetical protein
VGIAPQLSDAELVAPAMMRAVLGFPSEARWLRHAHGHPRYPFPCLPKQSGYHKRLRKPAGPVRHVTVGVAACMGSCRQRNGPSSTPKRGTCGTPPPDFEHIGHAGRKCALFKCFKANGP